MRSDVCMRSDNAIPIERSVSENDSQPKPNDSKTNERRPTSWPGVAGNVMTNQNDVSNFRGENNGEDSTLSATTCTADHSNTGDVTTESNDSIESPEATEVPSNSAPLRPNAGKYVMRLQVLMI